MDDIRSQLESAFSEAGHDVGTIAENRRTVRIELKTDSAEPDEVRDILDQVVGEAEYIGLDIDLGQPEGTDDVGQVISFRRR